MTRETKSRLVAAVVLAAMLGLLPAYLEAFTISGPSDAPTLLLGDRVIVNKAAFALKLPYSNIRIASIGTPRRGDLVLFRVLNRGALGVKRVVGLPGETIELRENVVFVNRNPLSYRLQRRENFAWVPPAHHLGSIIAREQGLGIDHDMTFSTDFSPVRNFPATKIPAGHYFLLGDHRDNSNDPRMFGPASVDVILGKVLLNLSKL